MSSTSHSKHLDADPLAPEASQMNYEHCVSHQSMVKHAFIKCNDRWLPQNVWMCWQINCDDWEISRSTTMGGSCTYLCIPWHFQQAFEALLLSTVSWFYPTVAGSLGLCVSYILVDVNILEIVEQNIIDNKNSSRAWKKQAKCQFYPYLRHLSYIRGCLWM
jgi:hypothetical protein